MTRADETPAHAARVSGSELEVDTTKANLKGTHEMRYDLWRAMQASLTLRRL
jgi:hypothetical protein